MTRRSRISRALEQQTERLHTLTEISRVLSSTLDLDTLYETIYQQVGRVMDTTRFFIALHRPDRNMIELVYHREEGDLIPKAELPFGQSVTSLVIEQGRALHFQSDADYTCFGVEHGLPAVTVGKAGSESMIFVPLNTGSRTIGALTVQSARPGVYTDDDVQTLMIIASQAAVAIVNARLYAQGEALLQVSQLVSGRQSLEQVLDAVLTGMAEVVPFAFACILVPDHGAEVLRIAGMAGSLDAIPRSDAVVPFGRGVTGRAFVTGKAQYYPDVRTFPGYVPAHVATLSEVAVPLTRGDAVIGILNVERTEVDAFTPDDVSLLVLYAGQAAMALANAQLVTEQQRRVDELTTIQSLVQKLSPLHDVMEIAEVVDQELKSLIDYHSCRLFGLDAVDQQLVLISSSDTASARFSPKVGQGITGWVAEHGVPVIIPNTLADPRVTHIPGTPLRQESIIGAPLVYEGRVQGVITLSRLGTNQFDENDLRLLEIVAAQTAMAFDRARLYQELRTDAMTDELTGLHNRRYLMERLAEERSRSQRNGHVLGAIMIDIDRFKQVNDTYGHAAGDVVLQELAAVIRSLVRAEDIVVRFGGEEFVILLPETSLSGTAFAAKRIPEVVAAHVLPPTAGVNRITVSVGYSLLAPEDENAEVISRADQAMYHAKRRGGNCVGSILVGEDGPAFLDGQDGMTPSIMRGGIDRDRPALEALDLIAVALDTEGRVNYVNPSFLTLTGYSKSDVLGKDWARTFLPLNESREVRKLYTQLLQLGGAVVRESRIRTKGGDDRRILWHHVVMRDDRGEVTGTISLGEDVTGQHECSRDDLVQRVDVLTGFPNRAMLLEALDQEIVKVRDSGICTALLLMDVDRFKEINESFGHEQGDLLLRQLAVRLRELLREEDIVARLGGDEFAVMLRRTNAADALLVAERILGVLERPVPLDGHRLEVRVSVGIALAPEHGDRAGELLRYADVAMYVAKRSGQRITVYSRERDENDAARVLLIGDLRRAIEHNELSLQFQPKVRLSDNLTLSAEALVRWMHPKLGPIPPDRFIPLAEETGLIQPLTRWVLNEALRIWSRAREQGVELEVSVNVSVRVLHDPCFASMVAEALDRHKVPPSALLLEVTESAVMADPTKVMTVLRSLHRTGVRVSIDDFGTGYSSLAYLTRLPVDEIKIDKSFVLGMNSSAEDAIIVRSVIDLGHNLGLQVVAEGVETQDVLHGLHQFGCDQAQGYYLSPPLDPEALLEWYQLMCTSPA